MSNLHDVSEELHLLGREFKNRFSISYLQELASGTGMIRRNRKCQAKDLVSLCVFLSQRIGTESLVNLCAKLHEATGISLSAEALNKRFNERTVKFLKELFRHVFYQRFTSVSLLPSRFTRIRILDSTSFQLPEQCVSSYKGVGGGGSKAGVKIQLEYELLSGEFLELHVGDGKSSDCAYGQERTKTLEKGDLILRDLGYFSIYDLEEVANKKAFYVSRIRWNTQVYQKGENGKWILLNVETLTKDLKEGESLELPEAHIGLHQKHKTRLVLYRLTSSEWEKRLEQHKKTKKRMPKHASRINLFITNVQGEELPTNEIYRLYSLRWQIEVLFKTWKSIFSIHKVKSLKVERFQCHLYGQLIGLCLVTSITYKMRELLWRRKKHEISIYKCTYIIQVYFPSIHGVLFYTEQHLESVLIKIFQDVLKNGRKARRYKKDTPFDILNTTQEYTM